MRERGVPRKTFHGDEDESIASFLGRRVGPDICERIAGPLLGGIFAVDPESLSARACVPQLVEAEAKYGSLVMAMRALRAARQEQATSGESDARTVVSLKRGIGDLVTYVAHRLRDAELSSGTAARNVARLPVGDPRGRWAVETDKGVLHADHVALTMPASSSSRIVEELDPTLASMLGDVVYASTATVFLAYRKYDKNKK